MDIGSLAEWVNAAAAALAFLAASFAGSVAVRSYKTQKAATERQLSFHAVDEQRRRQAERQALANRVAIWAVRGRSDWYMYGVNESGLPVYRLMVHTFCDEPRFSVVIERGTQGPAPAGKSRKLTNALQTLLEEHDAVDMDTDRLRVEIAFTDAAGLRWRRAADGRLDEVPETFDFPDAEHRVADRLVPWQGDRDSAGFL